MRLLNDSGEIRRTFRPLIRAWWFILFMAGLGAYLGYQGFRSENPSFEARATIQVNDKHSSGSEFLENFEAFSVVGEFLLEMEMIRSSFLIRKALKKLSIKTAYFQSHPKGWKQLYKVLPFELKHSFTDSSWLDREFLIEVDAEENWQLSFEDLSGEKASIQLKKGEIFTYKDLKLELLPFEKKKDIQPDRYKVVIRSEESLMAIFYDLSNLLVRLQDEHVALINIYYWHQHPGIATDFVNALASTYIEDFIERKKELAGRALGTLELQISMAELKLQEAEAQLFDYRDKVKIWEVGSFRKLHLDILTEAETRKLNASLKIKDLENLVQILDQLQKNQHAEVNYESIRDQGYLDALEQIVSLQKEIEKRSLNLTPEHPLIQTRKRELNSIIQDLVTRVSRTLLTYRQVHENLQAQLEESKGQILRLPAVEQNLGLLERKVGFRQRSLDSLNIKRIDAYISSMSDFTFHRILEHELPPEKPIKPLLRIKMGVNSLMYSLYAVFLIFLFKSLKGLITHAEELEDDIHLPIRAEAVLHNFPHSPVSQGIINLATDLVLDNKVSILTFLDYKHNPDKLQCAWQLGFILAELDKRTLILQTEIDSIWDKQVQIKHPKLDVLQVGKGENSFPAQIIHHKNWEHTLQRFTEQYDFVIFLVNSLKDSRDTLPFMLKSDLNLYVASLYKSKLSHLKKVQKYLDENEIGKTEIIILEKGNISTRQKIKIRLKDVMDNSKLFARHAED
ncbi:MAG: hypothetical protein R8P61_05385 [Bacteroidia bacterium]|nr:hypothetical protein [Bacteroidia bacterium]